MLIHARDNNIQSFTYTWLHKGNQMKPGVRKTLNTTTTLIKKRIGIDYKNYGKQCPGLEFRLIPKFISWAGLKPKYLKIPLG